MPGPTRDHMLGFEIEEPDSEAIASLLSRHGVVVVRKMLSPGAVDAVRSQVARQYEERDRAVRDGRQPADHPAVRHDSFLLDDFRTRVDDTGPLERLCDVIGSRLGHRLGREPVVLGHESRVKRQHPQSASPLSPFHQDPSFVKHRSFLIAWIPLDSCGENAPGLEVVPRALDRLLPVVGAGGSSASNPNYAHIEITQQTLAAEVDGMGERGGWRPVFAPGDVALLDQYTVHRTHVTTAMDRTRLTLVLRYVAR